MTCKLASMGSYGLRNLAIVVSRGLQTDYHVSFGLQIGYHGFSCCKLVIIGSHGLQAGYHGFSWLAS